VSNGLFYKRLSEANPPFDIRYSPRPELVVGCGSAVRFYCFIRGVRELRG
jgi:hypothetical protein